MCHGLGGSIIRQPRPGGLLAAALLLPLATAAIPGAPPFVPEVLAGFAIAPLTPVPIATSIAWGPGGPDGDDLYATTLAGNVVRISLDWTPHGPVATGVSQVVGGFALPLGLVFQGDVLFVADSTANPGTDRVDGRVWRVEDGQKTLIVGALPNGRHNTNNLRFGPDGRLYIANGNPNDDGVSGGDPDVFPYSGAILSVDVDEVTASPAILEWEDEQGELIPASGIAAHAVNADFASKVHVFAWGFRNVYDVAFSAAGVAYTATNGADATPSQDHFYRITDGAWYGFPFCYSVGTPGSNSATVVAQPNYPDHDCSGALPAQANLGWHVCATGIDIAPPGTFLDSAYVAECGPFFANDVLAQSIADPAHATHNAGHKVVRVPLDANGNALPVRDFITGLHLPTDVLFGPDGAMYVADVDVVYRVVELS